MGTPLTGIRVLDVSTFISGPLAALMLGDLGADVVKVEPPSRDPLLRWGRVVAGRGIVYSNCNRGKRVVTLDLKSDAGRTRLFELAAGADVLITNWRTGVADRLGLSSAVAENERLVWMRITGWGSDGPLADRPAFDGSVQARTGLAWAQGDDEPRMLRMFVADKITASFASQSILAALRERAASGRGQVIDLAMLDALAYFDFPDLLQNRALAGDTHSARNEQVEANGPMRTTDGWIVISPVGGRQLKATLAAVDREDAINQLRAAPTQHDLTRTLLAICSPVIRERSTEHWTATFDRVDVPIAPVLDIDGHLDDPQVVHNGIYDIVEDPDLGQARRARHPARFPGDDARGATTSVRLVDSDDVSWSDHPQRSVSRQTTEAVVCRDTE